MIAKALAATAFVLSVSLNSAVLTPDADAPTQLSEREKRAVMRPLLQSATECVARTVAADPRFGKSDITDLIVDSFRACVDPVRAMIDAHDRYYGAGTGQRFFRGPYLDTLPAAVTAIVGRAGALR
jgi:hypothetical protein